MRTQTRIALAQIVAERGDIQQNIKAHLRFIAAAHDHKATMVVFPELSLTGYEPDLAHDLALDETDARLQPLVDECEKRRIIAVVGAPVQGKLGVYIGEFIILPDGARLLYTKIHLHKGEEKYFHAFDLNPVLILRQEIVSFAICADISNPLHAERAVENKSTVYIASALVSDAGYEGDAALLRGYAARHRMTVMLVNHGGDSGGYRTAGRSALWDSCGELVSQTDGVGERLLVAEKAEGTWTGSVVVP